MKPLRFLFVNPIDYKSLVETSFPHLGLGSLSACLKQAFPGLETMVVRGHLQEWIHNWHPDLVGITAVSQYWNEAKFHAQRCKQGGLPVIIGGVHATALPHTMTEDMDVAVLTEGEETIVELVRLFQTGEFKPDSLAKIPGIAYHDHGQIVKSAERPMLPDLDVLPFADRSILPHSDHTSMFTSRGCPWICRFCVSTRYWKKMRFHSADRVAEEIHLLSRHVNRISFLDDLFIADLKRLAAIVDLLGRRDVLGKLKYICNVRSNLVNDDLCHLLNMLGVDVVGIGMESACQKSLEYLKGRGNITVEDHANAVEILRKHHIEPHPSFIIGSPFESRADIMETYRFIRDYKITNFEVYVLLPFPATPVWDYAASRGLVSDDMNWDRLRWQITDFGQNSIVLSETLSYSDLSELYNMFVRRREWPRRKDMLLQGAKHPLRAVKYLFQRL